jgi:hypothetical protein
VAEKDVAGVAQTCHRLGARLKVILETGLLTDEEKVLGCRIAQRAGADFVKTSTGFSKGGATVEDVALMRRTVGPVMGVKASGGVRDEGAAKAMIAAGATRIGASACVEIVRGTATSCGRATQARPPRLPDQIDGVKQRAGSWHQGPNTQETPSLRTCPVAIESRPHICALTVVPELPRKPAG